MEKQYIIYESAVTSDIRDVTSNGSIVNFTTVLQEADVKNRNGRIYPKVAICNGLKNPIIVEKEKSGTLFGECGHPYSTDIARQSNVDMRNAAFRILDFFWEGNLLYGHCQTLDTALGRDMAGLIKQGCKLSFSMRGQGNVVKDPYRDALVVSENLVIITFDWVWLPSHQTAYMTSIDEVTQSSMFNYNSYNDKQVALAESFNLYENGALIDITTVRNEKEVIDYRAKYSSGYMPISEMYKYSPKDIVREFKSNYVILENDNNVLYVNAEDYLLKQTRYLMQEMSCAGIAPTDNKLAVNPNDTLLSAVGKDVYETPLEKEIKEKVGDDAKDVSSSLVEESSVDQPEGVKLPEGTTDKKESDESNPEVKTNDLTDTKHTDKDVKGKTNEELKEEFKHYYNIIAEETHLTNKKDIINEAIKYSDFMSKECALLFKSLAKDGE